MTYVAAASEWIFTARCYASAVLALGLRLSVCVCLVTSRSSTKTAKQRITQTTPHDSPCRDSSFLTPKISAKFERGHPLRGRRMQVGWVKIGDFRQITGYISKTVKDRHIVFIKVEWWHCRWPWVPPNHPKPSHFLHFAPPFTAS